MRTVIIWLLVFMPEVFWAARFNIKRVSGTVGRSLELQCPDTSSEEHKYDWCKGEDWQVCSDLVKRPKPKKKGNKERIYTKDNGSTLVMTDLMPTDSGVYWCNTKKNVILVQFIVSISSSTVNRGTTPATTKGLSSASPASSIRATTVRNEITSNSMQSAIAAGANEDPKEPTPDLLLPVLLAAGLFGLIFLGALCVWIILRSRRKSLGAELLKTDLGVGGSSQHSQEMLVNPLYVRAEIAAAKEQATFYTMLGRVPPSTVPEHFYEEIEKHYSDINSPTTPTVGQQSIGTHGNGYELHDAAENGSYSMVMAPVEQQGVL